jgi:tripartite-type tricarboxylate transporter receptor subunit TctC
MRPPIASTLVSMLVFCATVWGQEPASLYPSKSVLLIDAQAAGGPADREARLYAKKISGYFGQNFVIDSKPGAGTTIASAYVAKAKADGYTLQIVTGSFTIFPGLYNNLPFDTLKDFAPVSLMSERTTVFISHPGFPAKNFEEYIAYARANPRKINFSALGVGSGAHLGGVWLHGATNTQVTFIHYKGVTLQTPDLVAGRVDATFGSALSALPLIKAGKVRALAIGNDQRSNLLPGLPTVAEYVPGFNYKAWLGFVAPAATPPTIINKLNEAFVRAAKESDVAGTLESEGSIMIGSTPAQFRQFLVTDTNRNRKLMQDNGIKLSE